MPLDDWSRGPRTSQAEYLDLPGDWRTLLERYVVGLDGGAPLAELFEVALHSNPTTCLVERDYIDRDYRDEFANFYAQTFREIPDRCVRVHFLDPGEKKYIGFSVLRPIIGRPVCRTMLAPSPRRRRFVSCMARSQPSPYGFRFTVDAFPFISQDSQYGVCAHAAIWMVAHYFHLKFRLGRFQLSDIVRAAAAHPEIDRSIPSAGLSHRQISAVLQEFGMPAISYVLQEDGSPAGFGEGAEETAETIACRYLNSGLPVIRLFKTHAQVLIGYGRGEDGDLFFVSHDDARGPYQFIAGIGDPEEQDSDHPPRRLVVPLPGRIYLAGEAAERAGDSFFRGELSSRDDLAQYKEALGAKKLRLRTYIQEIRDYRRELRSRGLPTEVASAYAKMSASRWVWVVELQDVAAAEAGPDCVVAEVVIDSTSDDRVVHFLYANLPGTMMFWPQHGSPGEAIEIPHYEPYRSGCALHVP